MPVELYRSNIATGGKVISVKNVVRRAVGLGGQAGGQRGPRDDRRPGTSDSMTRCQSDSIRFVSISIRGHVRMTYTTKIL